MENTKINELRASLDYAPLINIDECESKFKSIAKPLNEIGVDAYFIFTKDASIWNNRESILEKYHYSKSGCGVFAIVRGYKEIEMGNCCKIEEDASGCIIGFTAHDIVEGDIENPQVAKYDLGMKFLRNEILQDVISTCPACKMALLNANNLSGRLNAVADEWESSTSGILIYQQQNENEASLEGVDIICKADLNGFDSFVSEYFQQGNDLLEEFEDSFLQNETIRNALKLSPKDKKSSLLHDSTFKFVASNSTDLSFKKFINGWQSNKSNPFPYLQITHVIYDYVSNFLLGTRLKNLKRKAKHIVFDPSDEFTQGEANPEACFNDENIHVLFTSGNSALHHIVRSMRNGEYREFHKNISSSGAGLGDLAPYVEATIRNYKSHPSSAAISYLKNDCGLSEEMCKEFLDAMCEEGLNIKNSEMLESGFYPIFDKAHAVVLGLYNPAARIVIISQPVFINDSSLGVHITPHMSYYMQSGQNQSLEFNVASIEALKFAKIIGVMENGKIEGKEKINAYIEELANSPMVKFLSYVFDVIADNIDTYDTMYSSYINRKAEVQQWMFDHKISPRAFNFASSVGEKVLLLKDEDRKSTEEKLQRGYVDTKPDSSVVPKELDTVMNNPKIKFEGSGAKIINDYMEHFIYKYFNFNNTMHFIQDCFVSKAALEEERARLYGLLNQVNQEIAKHDKGIASAKSGMCFDKNTDIQQYIQNSIIGTLNAYTEDLDAIASFPRTKSIYFNADRQRLYVDIKDTYVEDDRTGLVYDMGDVTVSLPFSFIDEKVMWEASPNAVGWFWRSPDNRLISSRGKYGRAPVVHGDGNDHGTACLGNARAMFNEVLSANNLLGAFMLAVRYADSVNTSDSRGASVCQYKLKNGQSLVWDVLPWLTGDKFVNPKYTGGYWPRINFETVMHHLVYATDTFVEFEEFDDTAKDATNKEIVDRFFECLDTYNQTHTVKIIYDKKNGFDQDLGKSMFASNFLSAGDDDNVRFYNIAGQDCYSFKYWESGRGSKEARQITTEQFLTRDCHLKPENIFIVFPYTAAEMVSALDNLRDPQNLANQRWGLDPVFADEDAHGNTRHQFPVMFVFREADDQAPFAFTYWEQSHSSMSMALTNDRLVRAVRSVVPIQSGTAQLDIVRKQINKIFS